MRFRSLVQLLTVLLLFSSCFGTVQADSFPDEGTLIFYLGESEVGRETFIYTEDNLMTEGIISLGVQTITTSSSLRGSGGQWRDYNGQILPGASFSAMFKPAKVTVQAGPLKRDYPLSDPYVVLDNNMFAHYQQVIAMVASGEIQDTVDVVVPSLILANQNPVLTGNVEVKGIVHYELDDKALLLEEYIVTMPGNLQIRLLGNERGQLIFFEIPMQAVQVVRDGYQGLKKVEKTAEQTDHFIAEDFVVMNSEISLAGTLALPLGEGPFPAVLLNSGSGPQDRKGNTPPVFMTNMFSIMTEQLTKAGFAVLTYDERGVGESTGDYNEATLTDLLSDVEALLSFLGEHPQIDATRIGMLGHSEGAYFAPLFASQLHAIVLLAGPSITLDLLMEEQLQYQAEQSWLSEQEKELIRGLQPQIQRVLADAKDGKSTSEIPMNLDWLREHMSLDPLGAISKVTNPVLIVHGERDLKVMPYHAEELAKALREAGNGEVTVHYLPETTHEFTFFPYDEEFDPLDPFRLNPQLLTIVVEWIGKNL